MEERVRRGLVVAGAFEEGADVEAEVGPETKARHRVKAAAQRDAGDVQAGVAGRVAAAEVLIERLASGGDFEKAVAGAEAEPRIEGDPLRQVVFEPQTDVEGSARAVAAPACATQ